MLKRLARWMARMHVSFNKCHMQMFFEYGCIGASAWNGIFLMEVGDLEGSRSKISKLMDVKKAWTKAADLDKSYATPHHLLGDYQ